MNFAVEGRRSAPPRLWCGEDGRRGAGVDGREHLQHDHIRARRPRGDDRIRRAQLRGTHLQPRPPEATEGERGAGDVSKNDEFCIKNEEFCIKNEDLCIKNEELCMKNDEFCRRMVPRGPTGLGHLTRGSVKDLSDIKEYKPEPGFEDFDYNPHKEVSTTQAIPTVAVGLQGWW